MNKFYQLELNQMSDSIPMEERKLIYPYHEWEEDFFYNTDKTPLRQMRTTLLSVSSQESQKLEYRYFVTINPRKSIVLSKFMKVVNKYVKKKRIDDAIWCYEQRGTPQKENIGKGLHCHIMVKSRDKDFIRNTRHSFKNVVKYTKHNENKVCNIYRVLAKHIQNDKLRYIRGHKDTEEKIRKAQGDIVYRIRNDLDDVYIKNRSVFIL